MAEVKRKDAAIGCLLAIVAAILLVASIAMCSPDESRPAEGTVAGLNREFREVTRNGDLLFVRIHIENAWDEKGWLDAALRHVERIGRAMNAGSVSDDDPPLELVRVAVSVPATDRLGESVESNVFRLTFAAADLRRANFDQLETARIAELAHQVEVNPGGRAVVMAWCGEPGRQSAAPGFCRRALSPR